MKKSGSCVAQTMKGEGVFVPGFFLRCSILFLSPFPAREGSRSTRSQVKRIFPNSLDRVDDFPVRWYF